MHLGVKALVHVVLVVVVYLVEKILVFDAKELVLEECHVCLLVLDILESLLCLLVVADEMIVFTLFLLLLVINLEKLDFSLELLI